VNAMLESSSESSQFPYGGWLSALIGLLFGA
jgi:hypothetical protein